MRVAAVANTNRLVDLCLLITFCVLLCCVSFLEKSFAPTMLTNEFERKASLVKICNVDSQFPSLFFCAFDVKLFFKLVNFPFCNREIICQQKLVFVKTLHCAIAPSKYFADKKANDASSALPDGLQQTSCN